MTQRQITRAAAGLARQDGRDWAGMTDAARKEYETRAAALLKGMN